MSAEVTSKQKDPVAEVELLNGFVELEACCLSHELFSSLTVETPDEDCFSISLNGVTAFVLSQKLWSDPKRMALYVSRVHLPEFVMIGVGDADELQEFSKQFSLESFYSLMVPTHVRQVYTTIYALLLLKEKILHSESTRQHVQDTNESIKYVLRVSRELNGVRDTNKLLSLILMKAREITNADAGSIYVVKWEDYHSQKGSIQFKVTQNESVTLNLQEFEIPISNTSIVGNAVIHEESINIPDLYLLTQDPKKNPYGVQHDRSWDQKIGYQCRSMLSIPMFDISNRVIGVIQLINRKKKGIGILSGPNFEEQVDEFDDGSVEYAEIVAHQAGIALENALLTEEREDLFEGFVHASVTAIEQRDPTTSGHSHRVAKLTLESAKVLNYVQVGPYKDLTFSDDQLKEIEYASLLHDFGKLGVREEVLVKAKKLYPKEQELVLERFDHMASRYELEYANEVIEYLQNPDRFPPGFGLEALKASRDKKLNQLQDYLNFVIKSNEPTVLEQGGFEKLKDIANMTYQNVSKETRLLLTDQELKALSVSRGSLTREEFAEIQSHVTHTYEFLRKIPWGQTFANLPQIAAKHHEKLDGSGYPTAAFGAEIPVQSRLMTIADIFDALTAADRPYKKAVPLIKALDIIEMEVKAGKLDRELFKIFVESKVYETVIET